MNTSQTTALERKFDHIGPALIERHLANARHDRARALGDLIGKAVGVLRSLRLPAPRPGAKTRSSVAALG